MYEGPSPLPDGIPLIFKQITSEEGPIHLKVTLKGQNMAYRQMHIGKTTFFSSNFKHINGQNTPLPTFLIVNLMCAHRHNFLPLKLSFPL